VTRIYWIVAFLFGALGSFDLARGEIKIGVAAFAMTVVVALAIAERQEGDDR
jgi:hypothetical protein